jgi:hypothetical protein
MNYVAEKYMWFDRVFECKYETVSFKIYDAAKNLVKNVDKTIAFKTNEHYGNLFQAYPCKPTGFKSVVEMLVVSFTSIVRKR